MAGAAELLARTGVQGATFSEIITATGAPRGSIYHHFPGGKDELLKAAIDHLASEALRPLEGLEGSPAEDVARAFLDQWRSILLRSQLQSGCAILAVTVSSGSPALIAQAAAAFASWRRRMAILLELGGLKRSQAEGFAAMLIASTQGAMVFSRAERSLEPFETVCVQLLEQLGTLLSRIEPM
ncbi:TetR/AcrR family transcriptional regulator [Beijerinckia sp. L45]|uniref:TetR/AcrR family transcriptional regulator n=1 Tax=Beijerinckia sp. L45 TaxID=1641855 RepID=UPI001AEF1CD6|nr:TetR/AcrR family transcriptional regulator [Beijerinckia sp. L45]